MSKEAVISKDEIRLEVEKIELDKAKGRCRMMALATGAMGIFKAGTILGPEALAILKGSTLFLGSVAVPNYFLISAAGLVVISTAEKFVAAREKMREDKAKSKSFKQSELFQLEDENDESF